MVHIWDERQKEVFEPNPRQQGLKPVSQIAATQIAVVFEPNPRQQGLKRYEG